MEIQKSKPLAHGITAYSNASITVAQTEYFSSLIIGASILESPFGGLDMSSEIWDKVIFKGCELVLIGLNGGVASLPMHWRRYFAEKQIGLEVMNIGSACRTFNILLEEERQVLAWFILDEQA